MECSICIEKIRIRKKDENADSGEEYDTIGELLPCHHKFHSDCIRKWHSFANDLKCPICRVMSITMYIIYDYKMWYERRLRMDIRKGFLVGSVLDYENLRTRHDAVEMIQEPEVTNSASSNISINEDAEFCRSFQTFLNLEDMNDDDSTDEENEISINQQVSEEISMCKICGDNDDVSADTVCPNCDSRYHESCLHSTACEVGESDTWQQCIECETLTQCLSNDITHRPMPNIESEIDTELDTIRQSKRKIQDHVRKILNEYYKESSELQISKDHFTAINKTVSRLLYTLSGNKYQADLIDYDNVARTAVITELHTLGYTNA